VGRISTEENAVVESVLGRDPLSDGVATKPVDASDLELEGLKDLLGSSEADVLRCLGSFCPGR
jgi:hypothetical protein